MTKGRDGFDADCQSAELGKPIRSELDARRLLALMPEARSVTYLDENGVIRTVQRAT